LPSTSRGGGTLGQRPPVRAAEAELAVGLSIELVALLVNRAVVPATSLSTLAVSRRCLLLLRAGVNGKTNLRVLLLGPVDVKRRHEELSGRTVRSLHLPE